MPIVIGHRGASAYAPENTLAAIDKAARLGIGWVENDVQRTKDGELVVIHDDSLQRTTDVEEVFPCRTSWDVKDFTAAEIARLDAGSWFGRRYAGARVPTLDEYMRRVEHNHQKLLLEIKNPELYPGIEQQTLKVLGNEDRLLLLCQLSQGEMCVSDLEEALDIRQPTLSQQLGVLRNEGVVATRRDGKRIFYSVADARLLQVLGVLYDIYCPKE